MIIDRHLANADVDTAAGGRFKSATAFLPARQRAGGSVRLFRPGERRVVVAQARTQGRDGHHPEVERNR